MPLWMHRQSVYQSMVAMLSEWQKELLFAVGKERPATELFADFLTWTRTLLFQQRTVGSPAIA